LLEGSPFPAARAGGGKRDSAEYRCACAWAHHAKRMGERSRRCKHDRYMAYFRWSVTFLSLLGFCCVQIILQCTRATANEIS